MYYTFGCKPKLPNFANLQIFGCFFSWQAPFFKSINTEYSYPVHCSFRTWLIASLSIYMFNCITCFKFRSQNLLARCSPYTLPLQNTRRVKSVTWSLILGACSSVQMTFATSITAITQLDSTSSIVNLRSHIQLWLFVLRKPDTSYQL